jgi:F-type H+-transporting ATPase subunit epsilon
MSATAATSAYWRAAGMTYLKYANLCAEVLRGSLKEPFLGKVRPAPAVWWRALGWAACRAGWPGRRGARRAGARLNGRRPWLVGFLRLPRAAALTPGSPRAQAKAREIVYFKATPFADGKAGKPGAWQRSAARALGLRRATHASAATRLASCCSRSPRR